LSRSTWARIRTLSGGEALRAQTMVPEATVELEIRYRAERDRGHARGLRRADLQHRARRTTSTARHQTLLLTCTEGLNQGG
jgi:head-tail adaptor